MLGNHGYGTLTLTNLVDNQSSETSTALPISIQGLTKKYDQLHALDSVDLDGRSGEFLTLLGPSGSGKTTLLMAIAGFNRPDAGSIRFGETEMILTPPHRRNVGMVFQSYALFPHMTVAENIAFPLKLRGVGAKESAERVAAALSTATTTTATSSITATELTQPTRMFSRAELKRFARGRLLFKQHYCQPALDDLLNQLNALYSNRDA